MLVTVFSLMSLIVGIASASTPSPSFRYRLTQSEKEVIAQAPEDEASISLGLLEKLGQVAARAQGGANQIDSSEMSKGLLDVLSGRSGSVREYLSQHSAATDDVSAILDGIDALLRDWSQANGEIVDAIHVTDAAHLFGSQKSTHAASGANSTADGSDASSSAQPGLERTLTQPHGTTEGRVRKLQSESEGGAPGRVLPRRVRTGRSMAQVDGSGNGGFYMTPEWALQALQSLAEQQVQQPVHTASKISFEPVARVDVILPDGPESTPPPISASSSAPSPSQQPPSAREAFEVSPTGATGPQIPGAFASEVDSTEDHVEVEKGATPLGTVLQALLSEENSKALRAVLVDGYEEYAVVDEMIRTLEEMQRLKREMEVAQRGKASEVNFRGRVDHSMRDSREAQLRQELTERTRELVEEAQRLSAGATLLEKDIETSADVLALRLEEALAAVYGQAGRDAAIAYNAAHGNDAEKRKDGVLAGIDAVPSIDGVILP